MTDTQRPQAAVPARPARKKTTPRKPAASKAASRKKPPVRSTGARKPAAKRAPSAPRPRAVPAPAVVEHDVEFTYEHEQHAAVENTSGMGDAAVVPAEIDRWNWGAFILSGIWAIAHGVWIGLLAFVPFVGFIMSFVLGSKGNEWAWRKKRWASVDSFKRSQRNWALGGVAVLAVAVVLSVVSALLVEDVPTASPGQGTTTTTTVADYAAGRGGVRAGNEYGFSATFPSEPTHQSITQQAGDVDLPIDFLTSESTDSAFQVGVVSYPDTVDVSNPRALLRAAANGSAAAIDEGSIVRYADTTVDGDPAAGVLISGANGVYARQRYVLHGHKLFTIQVVSSSQTPPGFGRFVSSFDVR
jgi:hypothetical protein